MKNLTSDNKKFLCICQLNFIVSSDIRNHIKKPSIHIIKPFKETYQSKSSNEKGIQRYDLIESFQKSFFESYYFIIKKTINYFTKYSAIKTSNFDNQEKYSFPSVINSILNKSIIKEITHLKYSKKITKSRFQRFFTEKMHYVYCLSISENYLISGGVDGKVRIWSKMLSQIACLIYHKSIISAMDIDRFSRYALSGSHDKSICLWNIKKQKLKTVFVSHQNVITSLKFLENSNFFLSGSHDQSIRYWDTVKKSLIFIICVESPVRSVSSLSNNPEILVACESGVIYKISSSKKLTKKISHKNLWSSKLGEETEVLMTGHEDGMIQFVNTNTLHILDSSKAHLNQVNSIGYCKNTKSFLTCSYDAFLKFWCSTSFKILRVFQTYGLKPICLEISNSMIYVGSFLSIIYIMDTQTQMIINITKLNRIFECCLSVSIKLNLIAYGFEEIHLFSLKSFKNLNSKSFSSSIKSLKFQGSIILCGTERGDILLLDTPYLNIRRRFFYEVSGICFLSVSKDWNMMVHSYQDKSMFRNLRTSEIIKNYNYRIEIGKFVSNSFVFKDSNNDIFIFENFNHLRKIINGQGIKLFILNCKNYILIQHIDSNYLLIDLNICATVKIIKRLSEAHGDKIIRDLKMKKEDVIFSSLDFGYILT